MDLLPPLGALATLILGALGLAVSARRARRLGLDPENQAAMVALRTERDLWEARAEVNADQLAAEVALHANDRAELARLRGALDDCSRQLNAAWSDLRKKT